MSDAILKVKVVPNSSREQLVGWLGEAYKIKLQAPPEDGKANKALKRLLANKLGVNQKDVVIERGETSPDKLVRINGLSQEELAGRLPTQ